MQNNMQIWLESSTTTFNLNSHEDGVYLISDLDGLTSLPSIRTSAGVNAGTDGGWTSAQAFDARLISVRVVITNEDVSVVETKRRQLNSLLAQSRKETLKLHFLSEGGMEYVINVRITNVTGALTNILKKQELLIQMRADDPIIYGSQGGGSADATLNVQQAIGGFEIPFDIPLIIDGGTDKVNVENLGSEEVYPTIKMTGPLHNPTVVNETQDAEIGVNADLGDMEWKGYESLQLLGNATQETIAGKNLWGGFSADFTKSVGGITLTTKKDGTITTSAGTSTAAGYSMNTSEATNNGFLINLKAGTYTLSGGVSQVTLSVSAGGQEYRADAQTGKITFALVSDTTGFVRLTIASGATITAQTIKPMFELGSTASDYEPYVGGVPSPNPDYPQAVNVVSGEQTVRITGKNLFNFQEFASYVADNGITRGTATTTSNSITLTATSNDCYTKYGYLANIPPIIKVKKNTNMVLSWKSSTTGAYKGFVYMFGINATGGANVIGNAQDIAQKQVFNTGDYDTLTFRLGVSASGNSITYSDIMLEYGSQPSEYAPYQSQSLELNLGKNLLDASALVTTGITLADGVLSGTAGAFSTAYGVSIGVPITTTATQLAVSLKAYTDAETPSTNNGLKIRAVYKDGSGADIIPFTNDTTTATYKSAITSNTKEIDKIAITFGNYPNNTWHISDFQIEASPYPTSYAPYKTPIELCKIGNYTDGIKQVGDKWYIHKEVGKAQYDTGISGIGEGQSGATVASTEGSFFIQNTAWNYAGGDYDNDIALARMSENIGQYVEQNLPANGQARSMQDGTFCQRTGTNDRIYFRCSGLAGKTGTEVKAILQPQGGAQFYYALATPTDTEITDQSLIDALNSFVNSAPWYGEDQNIFLIPSGGAQGTLIIGDHIPPKPADEVLIDTQLKTVTLNGQNIYHLLKEGSSFFTLAPGDNSMYLTSDVSSDTGKAEIKFKQGFVSI